MGSACSPAHDLSKQRGPSRKKQVVEILRRDDGVTIEQLLGMFNWESSTARAAISVASKRLVIKVERGESPARTGCHPPP